MGHRGEVHDFLNVALAEHCETCLAASHDITVVTEDVQSLCRDCSCADVEHTRKLLSSNLVHVRDHQQKSL